MAAGNAAASASGAAGGASDPASEAQKTVVCIKCKDNVSKDDCKTSGPRATFSLICKPCGALYQKIYRNYENASFSEKDTHPSRILA